MQSICFTYSESHSLDLWFTFQVMYIFHWFKKLSSIFHQLYITFGQSWCTVVNSSTRDEGLQPRSHTESSVWAHWETPLLASCWEDHSPLSFTACLQPCSLFPLAWGTHAQSCLTHAFLSSVFTKDRSALRPRGPDLPKTAVDRSEVRNENWALVAGMGTLRLRMRSRVRYEDFLERKARKIFFRRSTLGKSGKGYGEGSLPLTCNLLCSGSFSFTVNCQLLLQSWQLRQTLLPLCTLQDISCTFLFSSDSQSTVWGNSFSKLSFNNIFQNGWHCFDLWFPS